MFLTQFLCHIFIEDEQELAITKHGLLSLIRRDPKGKDNIIFNILYLTL